MPSPLARLDPNRPPLRWLLRLPNLLYEKNLGWLLGTRFVQLTIRGRRTGLPRQVVLEVIGGSAATGEVLVVSAWGRGAQWFKNVIVTPQVQVRQGRRRFAAEVIVLGESNAAEAFRGYAQNHRLAYAWFIGPLILGHRPQATANEFEKLARALPVLMVRAIA